MSSPHDPPLRKATVFRMGFTGVLMLVMVGGIVAVANGAIKVPLPNVSLPIEVAAPSHGPAAPSPVVPQGNDQLARLVAAMDQLDAARVPYCFGGGHLVTPAKPTTTDAYCIEEHKNSTGNRVLAKHYNSSDIGLDCSSSVSLVLQQAGFAIKTKLSWEFNTWGDPGPGQHVTIYSLPSKGDVGHVFMVVDDRYWGTSTANYREGPGWHPARPTKGYVATHPHGL